ncbi:MAG: dephospho-CoA kinase [Oscillospiraceae bacterium]|nr:dephospho-CoA kinase [Oscillospiraceae bacterium]
MKIIGLTGNSGSGKTTASEFFKNAGFMVINCDKLAREVVQKGSPCLFELCEFFGQQILSADGTLDRKKLAQLAFSSKEKTARLNQITHKYIIEKVHILIQEYKLQGCSYVVIDAPVLYESALDKICDLVVAVTADESVRVQRLALRDNITSSEAMNRFKNQKTLEFFEQNADFVVINDNDKENFKKDIEQIITKLKGE